MRLAILSRGRTLYTTRRLAKVGRRRGHDVRILNPNQCTIAMETGSLNTRRDGLPVDGFDCVIARVGGGSGRWDHILLRQIELQGITLLNSSFGTLVATDKVRTIQELTAAGVAVPTSLQTKDPTDLPDLIARVNGPPAILKLLSGTQGVGVIKADTVESAVSIMEALWSLGEEVLVQEFVAESSGSDVRALVVDGRLVGAMERVAGKGEFRANVHRGGSTQKITLDDDAHDLAVAAADALDLRVAGVDLLLRSRGPLVIEVNASPGLEGIEGATGHDIAKAIIKCAESLV